MIRVTVELISGNDGHLEHLGTAIIGNDLSGDRSRGNYDVYLSRRGRRPGACWWHSPSSVWRRGRVEGFPRERLLAWDLLYRALAATVGARNA